MERLKKLKKHLSIIYRYDKGPPDMLTGMFAALSVSTLMTNDWPVFRRLPEVGCLSMWKLCSLNLKQIMKNTFRSLRFFS
jgi:hypothetical protein